MIKRIASTVIRSVPLSQWGKTAAEKTGRAENRTRDKTDRSVLEFTKDNQLRKRI